LQLQDSASIWQAGETSILMIAAKADPTTKIAAAISKMPFLNINFSYRILD